ncbi:MAG: YqeG family HAD IIIA-type phosphatase [Oscillospiraceae bacterium]|nr:YqeG family HAD IIIA-type phosphatase [Oscillospiraceae bacterium]
MSVSLIPDITAPDVFSVTPQLLTDKGVTLLMLDLDNTLSPYSEDLPPSRLLAWMEALQGAGVTLYIISNNRSRERIRRYAEACGISHVARAKKPSPKALHAAMKELGRQPEQTALMGDQIFTDGLAANRAGAVSIVIKPLEMKGWFGLRYILEQPFRLLAKEKLT